MKQIIFILLLLVFLGSNINAENTIDSVNHHVDSNKINRLYLRLPVSYGYGEFYKDLSEAFSDYTSLTIGLGLNYRNYYVNLSGDLGLASLTKGYLGKWQIDNDDTTHVGLSNVEMSLGYRLYSIGRLNIISYAGVHWNDIGGDVIDSVNNNSYNPKIGWQAGFALELDLGSTGKSGGNSILVNHYISISCTFSSWTLDYYELGSDNMYLIRLGYIAGIKLFEL